MRPLLFAMVSTRDSASYTPHAIESFDKFTEVDANDRLILIENEEHLDKEFYNNSRWERLVNPKPKSFAANANAMIEICIKEERDLYFLNNDIIFSSNWLNPLKKIDYDCVATPLSNREVPYVNSVTSVNTTTIVKSFSILPPPMYLENYLGNEDEYQLIAKTHSTNFSGFWAVMVMPFFAVKIPFTTLQKVGLFDEEFGEGGGEDFDYALRANLLGIPVGYAVDSYLLHFGGKSTWEGAEESKKQARRQEKYREVFKKKWGEKLFDLILNENRSLLENDNSSISIREKILMLKL